MTYCHNLAYASKGYFQEKVKCLNRKIKKKSNICYVCWATLHGKGYLLEAFKPLYTKTQLHF